MKNYKWRNAWACVLCILALQACVGTKLQAITWGVRAKHRIHANLFYVYFWVKVENGIRLIMTAQFRVYYSPQYSTPLCLNPPILWRLRSQSFCICLIDECRVGTSICRYLVAWSKTKKMVKNYQNSTIYLLYPPDAHAVFPVHTGERMRCPLCIF